MSCHNFLGMPETCVSADMTTPVWEDSAYSYTQLDGKLTVNPEQDQLPLVQL